MLPHAFAEQTYGDASLPTKSDRNVEYQAFAHATRGLNAARKGQGDLARAILDNRRLWILLTGDAAHENNRLPDELRAQIISLGLFVQQHSVKVMDGTSPIDALIDINTAIMRGLRSAADS